MRAPENEATGTSGQSFVKAKFEALGWGAVLNPEHDLGTDLWLMARDLRRFDLGALVGAQVKSGPSYFDESEVVDGKLAGWWYRENDDSHFSYWCDHNVPHILVLHRHDDNASFWVQVTPDRVISTGKGRKILVPASSVIDADHFDALLAVASSKPNVPQWEGSVWHVGRAVSEAARLRYALVTPRLIAPHPNAKSEQLTAHQAIALLVQMRMRDLAEYAKRQPLADPSGVKETESLTWRLYAALHRWIVTAEFEPLKHLTNTATSPEETAAVAVCVAHALFEGGRVSEGKEVVESTLLSEDINPVDRGWLEAHRARCLFELGDLEGARKSALDVQVLRHVAPGDPTASVLVGSAAQTIFNLGDWNSESLAHVVQSRDNVASWWRSQTLVTALDKQFDQAFKAWGNDTRVTIATEDVVWTRLRSTTLLAGYAADSPAWGYGATLLARRQLMTARDEESLVSALGLLRLAGAETDTKLAVGRLLEFGPVAPLATVSNALDLTQSTRTSLKSDLALLERAGDALPTATCDRHVLWALMTLENRDAQVWKLRVQFRVAEAIVDVVSALIGGTSDEVRGQVMTHVVCLPPVENQLLAGRYARLLRALGDSWSAEHVAVLATRSGGDNFEFTRAVDSLRAEHDDGFRATLVGRIAAGDLTSLSSYGDVRHLPTEAAAGMIGCLSARVESQTESARRGRYGIGADDFLRALVLLNVFHAQQANWEPCLEALAEAKSSAEQIAGAIRLLGAMADHLPNDVRPRLREPLQAIVDRQVDPDDLGGLFAGSTGARGEAVLAIAQLFPDSTTEADMRGLIRGEPGQRAAAVRIIIARDDVAQLSLLAALSKDAEVKVRAAVAYGLATWVARGVGVPGSAEVLSDLLGEPGVNLGLYVSRALDENYESGGVDTLIEHLRLHPSSTVRWRVSMAQSHRGRP